MQDQWIYSSGLLPHTGAPIEFTRLKNITRWSQGRGAITPPRDRVEIPAIAVTTLPVSKAAAHVIHSNPMRSNQMSS
jgi:hypothetical protein